MSNELPVPLRSDAGHLMTEAVLISMGVWIVAPRNETHH